MTTNLRTTILKMAWAIAMVACLIFWRQALAHVGNAFLPEGCGSCHVGHGEADQPMLAVSEEEFCYQCHGPEEDRSKMISDGRLSPAAKLADIEREFKKPFRHPVVDGAGHSAAERLPSMAGSRVTHAECVDCHNPHDRTVRGPKIKHEVTGYSLSGQYLETSVYEYEICLKCHADQFGADPTDQSVRAEFSLSVRSQHPVTRSGQGGNLPSLAASVGRGLEMRCSDCHTNDDPDGPQGPHGSNFQFLLSGNYSQDVYAEESPFAYEFCYSCHDRVSVLSNESFPLHREHIEGDPVTGQKGTSCFTCHASHGSREYPHLLSFNPNAVTRDGQTGLMKYIEQGDNSGQCYMRCHGRDHSPAEY